MAANEVAGESERTRIRPDRRAFGKAVSVGEDNRSPDYAMQGKIFAIGYIKGIAQTLNIPVM